VGQLTLYLLLERMKTNYNLFPTPVMGFGMTDHLPKEELDLLISLPTRKNVNNSSTNDTYVLKNHSVPVLQNFIQNSINEYFQEVYSTSNAEIYITQSWVNHTNAGESHHRHKHHNSLISGVFYLKAELNRDKIYFHQPRKDNLRIEPEQYNVYNSETWWLPVGQNDLFLFPSYLEHYVELVPGGDTRISLAFNTFVKGKIGSEEYLTELKLGEING
jgi:uncharacterized protein (TIGR02466 family)